MSYQRGSTEERSGRIGAGIVGGYIGFVFGLLVVLSMASEVEALPMHLSALAVFVHMVAGFAIGWLIHPVLKALFPN